jgi:signal transduction histidine kinase
MNKLIAFIFSNLFFIAAFCQPPLQQLEKIKTIPEKIDTLKAYSTRATFARDFNAALEYTEMGIVLSKEDWGNLGFFKYFRGEAFRELKKFDSAIVNTKQAIDYYNKAKKLLSEANAMRRLHYIYYYAGRGEERLPIMQKAQKIIDTTKNIEAKSVLIAMLSEYYYDQSLYEKAIDFKLKYIETQKNKKQPLDDQTMNDIAVTNSQVAETYLIIKEPTKAIQYLNEAKLFYKDYYHGEALSQSDLVTAYINLKQIDSALLQYRKLYNMMKLNDTLFEVLTGTNANLANYYVEKNDNKQALFYAELEYALSLKTNEPIAIMGSHLTLANVFCNTKEFEKAIIHLNIAEKNLYAFGRESVATLRQLQAKTYAGLGNWQQAYLKFDSYTILHDSILNESSTKNIAEAEAKFQNKEKQQQIENKNLQIKVGRNKILGLIAGLGLLTLVAFLLLLNNRNKKKTATILNEKNIALANLNTALEDANQTKAKLFSIIGHDLRSPISQVYQFLKLQQFSPELLDEEQKNKLSNKIQTATGSLLETMEDLLLWSKTQMNEFKTNIQTIKILPVIESCKNLLQLNSDAKNITFKNFITADVTAKTDAYFLQTIIRNLLQNAIKASPDNSEIEIGANNNENQIVIYIKNKGETFTQQQYQQILSSEDAAKSLNGLGLRLVDELSKKIDAVVEFKTLQTGETVVELQLANL